MNQGADKRAVVLLSGGMDSTTCLAYARDKGQACYALSVAYGQKHASELEQAKKTSSRYGCIEHRVVEVDVGQFGGSALTDSLVDVPDAQETNNIPITYVPARNTVMFSLALAWAEVLRAELIYVGVNAVDYSGYPDCRPEYIEAFNQLARLATKEAIEGRPTRLVAPLQTLSKAEIIQLGVELGVDYAETVSCYKADELGRACGRCDACSLRRRGFEQAKLVDPTRYI